MSDYSIIELEGVLILRWHKAMTMAGVQECATKGKVMMSRGRIGFLTILDEGVELSAPTEARRGMAEFISRNAAQISGAAIVYEETGFKASAVRSIITAINLTARSNFPNRVFSDVNRGIDWLVKTTGLPTQTADRLKRVCVQQRSRLAS